MFIKDYSLEKEMREIRREQKLGSPYRVNIKYAIFILTLGILMLASEAEAGWVCNYCGYYNLSDRVNHCGVCGSSNPNPRPRSHGL